jgi:hypothetical protein
MVGGGDCSAVLQVRIPFSFTNVRVNICPILNLFGGNFRKKKQYSQFSKTIVTQGAYFHFLPHFL